MNKKLFVGLIIAIIFIIIGFIFGTITMVRFLNLNIGGIYINNTALNEIIFFSQSTSGYSGNITNAIFLNNKCKNEISASVLQSDIVVNDCWFGNNASNFKDKPTNKINNVNEKIFANYRREDSGLMFDEMEFKDWPGYYIECKSFSIRLQSNLFFKVYDIVKEHNEKIEENKKLQLTFYYNN